MIRITIDNSKGSRLVVEGHLSGSAMDELRKSCATCGEGTVLDLSGLIFADRSGAVFLNELIAAGFVIEGCSGFIKELLHVNPSSAQQSCAADFVNDHPAVEAFSGRPQQPLLIRICHWCNVVFITVMAGSGLQILTAYPALGPRGEQYSWYPFQNVPPPSWLRIGGWLGGGRHWHFAIAWFLVANGLIYLCYFFASGEWRRRLFRPRRDAVNAVRQFAYYVRIQKSPPLEDFYNGLQRLSYSGVLLLGVVMVLSGLAIYKPVQFHLLTLLFGGYDGARVVHLAGLCLLGIFVVIHLVLVLSHPQALLAMVTGGKRGRSDYETQISERRRCGVTVSRV